MYEDPIDLQYEYLLRKLYKCGRYDLKGVDADVWRNLNGIYLRLKKNPKSRENKKEFKTEFEKIKGYINNALDYKISIFTVKKNIKNLDQFLDYKTELNRIKTFEKLVEFINRLHRIHNNP